MPDNLGRVGAVGRFKPLHKGGALMLETLCEQAAQAVIGIGSCNKYNLRNPFKTEEVREMINLVLAPKFNNYSLIEVPDFAQLPEYSDGKKWKEYVLKYFGKLDYFVSGNDYIAGLLKNDYKIIHPASIIPPEKHLWVKGTMVRMEMAKFGDWQSLVTKEVADYLEKNDLVNRFRREFGLATLTSLSERADGKDYKSSENKLAEYRHTLEA